MDTGPVTVVHALVTTGGRIAVWAEAAPAGPTPRRRSTRPAEPAPRRRSTRRAEPHPFAVAPPVAGEAGTVVLALPSAGSAPVPSPELGVRPGRGAPRTLPWSVPAVFPPAGTDLADLADGDVGDGPVRTGASVGYAADLLWFAADLVRRGRVLPALVVADGPTGGHTARWRPVLTAGDAERFTALHRAMPGVAGAARTRATTAGETTREALDHAVDTLVRARLRRPMSSRPMSSRPMSSRPMSSRPMSSRPAEGAVAAWLAALTGDPRVDHPDAAALREHLDRWADSGRPAPVRTCFRLSYVDEFAGGDTGGWLLEFLLQPADEPGLLVPATDVFADRAGALTRWVDHPQDELLAGLGRASRLYPDLDVLLREQRPTGQRLDTAGAYRFLTHATGLTEAGFGVLLPAPWQRKQDLGLTLTVHSRQPARAVLRDTTTDRAAVARFRWGLALGDEFLSEADMALLAAAKLPLVRLRGRWVHLDPDRLRAGLAFLARGGTGEVTAGEAMRLLRTVPDAELPLPVTGIEGSGWLADLLTGRAAENLELLDPPAGLAATLRPYQRAGLSWLAFLDRLGIGALLADDMGLGKTVQLLALEAWSRGDGRRPPTLIVCPLSVLGNWRREARRFTPGLRVQVYHGAGRVVDPSADLVLSTYQVVTRDVDLLAATRWDRIVLDEAQHVKNSTGVTARAVRRVPARHRVALTGTPVENRLTELWAIADFLNPGLLGPATNFRARYSVAVERYTDPDAAARLRRATRPFLLRREKTDRTVIADLPRKWERRQWCTLTAEQATLYRAVVDEMRAKFAVPNSAARHKGLVLSAITKLKQVCNHPAHLLGDGTPLAGRSGKLDRLEEILAAALGTGDRVLVFTQYVRFGAMLAPYLAGRLGTGVEFLHGGTSSGARDAMVDRFQTSAGPRVLLLSLKAGGVGLNLTAANHVVHVDRWWNPATETQATDRAFRIGQRRDVQVHTLACVGTVEERIDTVIAGKRALASLAVGSGDGWLTGLSTSDLLELVRLSPEAYE